MISGTIWLTENKQEHLIQDDPSKYPKDAWGVVWHKYEPTGREIKGRFEYMYTGKAYS
jgi:hypothetical protein